ncbi:MAG: RNA-binding domain-containing protein, partial [Candidatus Delongbacteria bacterium]
MKHGRIDDIINNGESQTLEFKKNFDQAALETVCAFANASGGVVLIGINDDKKPVNDLKVGPETLQNWINEIKNKTQPQLIIDAEIREYDGSTIAALFVDEYPIKPVALKGRYFKRVRNSNHQLSLSEISDLYLKTMNSSWDFHHDPHHSYEHISEEKILKFIRKVEKHNNSGISMTPYEFMAKMEFIRDGKITIGAFLLFAKDYCVITDIQAGRFKSPTKIIDDRIEFYNPGKLFGGITMEDLLTNNYTSQARNKVIAKAFKEIGSVERYGSGIKKVFDICRDYGV